MALFTIIAEYHGGTYVDQVTAPSPRGAIQKLSKGGSTLPEIVIAGIRQLDSEADQPISIGSTKNVWCVSTTHKRQLLLINVVKTAF